MELYEVQFRKARHEIEYEQEQAAKSRPYTKPLNLFNHPRL